MLRSHSITNKALTLRSAFPLHIPTLSQWMLVRLHLNKVTLTNEKSLLSLLYTHKADHLTIASAISCLR